MTLVGELQATAKACGGCNPTRVGASNYAAAVMTLASVGSKNVAGWLANFGCIASTMYSKAFRYFDCRNRLSIDSNTGTCHATPPRHPFDQQSGSRLDPTLVIARFISDDRFGKFLFLIFVNRSVTSVHPVRKQVYPTVFSVRHWF